MLPKLKRWTALTHPIFDHAPPFPSIDSVSEREAHKDGSFGRYLVDVSGQEGSMEPIEKQFWRHVAEEAAAGHSVRVTAMGEDVCIVTPCGVYPPGTKFSGDPK